MRASLHLYLGHGDHPDLPRSRVDHLQRRLGQRRVTRWDELRLEDVPGRRFRDPYQRLGVRGLGPRQERGLIHLPLDRRQARRECAMRQAIALVAGADLSLRLELVVVRPQEGGEIRREALGLTVFVGLPGLEAFDLFGHKGSTPAFLRLQLAERTQGPISFVIIVYHKAVGRRLPGLGVSDSAASSWRRRAVNASRYSAGVKPPPRRAW